jgi:tight adherence protein C
MALIFLVGLSLFLVFAVALMLMMPVRSPESVLLQEVSERVHRSVNVVPEKGWRSVFNADFIAKPFSFVRKFFSPEPEPKLVRRLMLAGYRKPSHADIFLGARLGLPAFLGFLVALLVPENTIFFFIITIVIAFFLPDFWLAHAINKRREEIRLSLPDGLDLLSICMEAGLGLDQGIVRTGSELRLSRKALSEELLHINFEQRAGVQRIAAWKSFAERVNLESVRSFVAMLVQTDRFGTPISKSLNSFSEALRTQRRQQAEEMAAKTTIKLVPPLVFFIFPSVGIVTVGPAVITVIKNMEHFLK